MKKYVGEALGTAVLTLVVGASLAGVFEVGTPVLAALTLGLFVYSLGHLSGTHINPAVTIGAWSIGKISNDDTLKYVIAQGLGAVVALFMLQSMLPEMATLKVGTDWGTGLAEALGTAVFTFGIAAVVYGKVQNTMSGVVVGGSLMLGIALAALLGSNGVLNPAVAFGIQSFSLMYVLGPVLGSVLGMQAYKRLAA
jgi:glycerol uptake facilitator-like aquaporin